MTYTSHGHHIPGTSSFAELRPKIDRCGGVQICKECKAEAIAVLPKDSIARASLLNDLDALVVKDPENYEHPSGLPITYCREPIVNREVMFFDGSEESVAHVQKWLDDYGFESACWPGKDKRPPRIDYIAPKDNSRGATQTIFAGSYVVRYDHHIWRGDEVASEIRVEFMAFAPIHYQERYEPASIIAPVPLSWNLEAN